MATLKNSIVTISLIALLAIAKFVLNTLHPSSAAWHDLLIFNYQLLLLLWLTLFLSIKLIRKTPFKTIRLTVPLIITTLLLDVLFRWMINNPSTIPNFCKQTFKDYYTSYYRNIIQFEPCSKYDSAFFYTLKPQADFPFGNVEFINSFSTNRLGLRDDNPSSKHPDVLCLGDSYTLGWGVDQNQDFPDVLEQYTRKKVLNVSMSSYGTARELKWLTKLDTSSVQYIIIQHCKNDADENHAFNNSGYLPMSSEASYVQQIETYRWQRTYFPGKYSITILYNYIKAGLRKIIKGSAVPYYLSNDPKASAGEFVKVLNAYSQYLQNKKVLIIDLNDFHELSGDFIKSVDTLLSATPYRNIKEAVTTIDVSKTLTKEDFYVLDAHLKPSGHRKIADLLSKHIR